MQPAAERAQQPERARGAPSSLDVSPASNPLPPQSRRELAAPPGPEGLPVVGVLPRIWRDPLKFFADIEAEYGGLARFGNRKFTLYLLSDPAAIQQVFSAGDATFWKGEGLAAARTVMGKGLATSHGEHWRTQRRRLQPAFAPGQLGRFVPLLHEALAPVFARWTERQRDPRGVDVVRDASRITQQVLFRGLFGGDVSKLNTDAMAAALDIANAHIHNSAWSLIPLPKWVPTPERIRFRRAMQLLDGSVYGLIAERRRALADAEANTRDDAAPADLLTRMLQARDPDGSATDAGMTDEMLRDEIMTLFVAGHDTTAASIAWALDLLAHEPALVDRLATEATTRLNASDHTTLTADDITALDLTSRTAQEVLRMRPPGWIVVRTPRDTVELCGYAVPADAPILISPWVVHSSPRLWDTPQRFDPDRFLPGRIAARPKFAWFPYGGGGRTCIGKYLADLVLRTVLAEVSRRFRIEPTGELAVPLPRTTLQPKAVRLRFVGR